MTRLRTRHVALGLSLAALGVAGCGSSSSSSSSGTTPASVVKQGNAPVKVAFNDPGYPAACEKSMETPDTKGNALSPAQAKTFCGCVQQRAQSQGLSTQSEESISVDQFRAMFTTCEAQLTGASTTTT
jgi:hypothetical protein